MGFIKEVYSDNRGGLAVAFRGEKNTSSYVNTDSVEEALKYFNMYVKNNQIYIQTQNQVAMNELQIEAGEAPYFRSAVNNLLHLLSDEDAFYHRILFPKWEVNKEYLLGERIKYNDKLYKVIQEHVSQEGWTPDVATSLFAEILIDEENNTILEWEQPDSTNGYSNGNIVLYNGSYYKSTADNNITIPETVGSLWVKTDIDGNELITDWVEGQTYNIGDHIIYKDYEYESIIDNNVWSPADYPAGWQIVE